MIEYKFDRGIKKLVEKPIEANRLRNIEVF